MPNLEALLHQLEVNFKHLDKENLEISKANVGWHLSHCTLVINGIITTLSKSNPADYKWSFNFNRMAVFALKKFPRGRGKAPKTVQPQNENTIENLEKYLAKTREKLIELNAMPNDVYFKHPYFDNLKKKQTITFLEIHTKHHLDIIRDILK
jgi:hypothetical protein